MAKRPAKKPHKPTKRKPARTAESAAGGSQQPKRRAKPAPKAEALTPGPSPEMGEGREDKPTVAEIARGLVPPISKRRCSDLFDEGMPRESIAAAQAWYEARPTHPARKLGSADLQAVGDPEEHRSLLQRRLLAEVLKAEQEARAKKLRADILDNRLYDREADSAKLSRFFVYLKDRLQALPEEQCSELPAEIRHAQRTRWEENIHHLLMEIGNYDPDGA